MYDDAELLEDLQLAEQEVDGKLTQKKYKKRMHLNGLSHPDTIINRFGSWETAKKIAGVK